MLQRGGTWIVCLSLLLLVAACGGEERAGPGPETGTGAGGTAGSPSEALREPGGPGATPASAAAVLRERETVADLGRLVPTDAVAILHVPDLDALDGKVRGVVAAFDPRASEEADVREPLSEVLGPVAALLDGSRPMALAVALTDTEEPRPIPVFVCAVTDLEAAQAAAQEAGMSMASLGDYVALSPAPNLDLGAGDAPPALARSVPEGDIVLRVDAASLVTRFEGPIEDALASLDRGLAASPGGPDLSRLAGVLEDMARTVLDSAQTVDLSLSAQGDEVHLRARLTVKAGSPLDGASPPSERLPALAGALPPDFPIVALFGMDMARWQEFAAPFLDAMLALMDEEWVEEMAAAWETFEPLYAHLGHEHAMAMRLDEEGMHLLAVSTARDAAAYLAGMDAVIRGDYGDLLEKMGMPWEALDTTTVAGREVRRYALRMDLEKMAQWHPAMGEMSPREAEAASAAFEAIFGEQGMVMNVAALEDRVALVMGGEEADLASLLAAAGRSGPPSGDLARSLAQAGRPHLLVHVDARALLKQAMGFASRMRERLEPDEEGALPALPDGDPVPVLLFAGGEGRRYTMGVTLNVRALADLVEDLQQMR